MKRILIMFLVLCLVFCSVGCSADSETPETTTVPVIPTSNELREKAVLAMRELLSIEWTPSETISYFNTAGRDKQFDYKPGTTYGGLLYTGASTGLIHFKEFYDPETGVLTYPGTPDELRRNIGSGCADSLLWSWATVSNSFTGGYYPSMMVYKNGFLPVGDYTYDFEIPSYYNMPTQAIIAKNGETVILDAYTKVLPADALISSSVDHAMMVIENPVVTYLEDGSIDRENSYVYIQDQRGGTSKGFLEEEVDGKIIHYNSARRMKMTFKELIEKNYIPVTLAEFIGTKEYDFPTVTVTSGPCETLTDMQNAVIEANYPLAVIRLVGIREDGTETIIDRELFKSSGMEGPLKTYHLSEFEGLQNVDTTGYSKLRIEVIVSTDDHFIPIEIEL